MAVSKTGILSTLRKLRKLGYVGGLQTIYIQPWSDDIRCIGLGVSHEASVQVLKISGCVDWVTSVTYVSTWQLSFPSPAHTYNQYCSSHKRVH
jgi:hypothetical protein